MKSSENTDQINHALSLFRAEVKPIVKDKSVSMKGTSKSGKEYEVSYEYAPLELLQEAANQALSKHGLTVNQFLSSEKLLENGSEYLQCVIITRIGHQSGQFLESTWPIDLSGITKEQDRGSKLTFNRRYCYQAALDLILVGEDNDAIGVENHRPQSTNKTKEVESKPKAQSVSNSQKITEFANKLNIDSYQLKTLAVEWNGKPCDFDQLSADQCKEFCSFLKTKKEVKNDKQN